MLKIYKYTMTKPEMDFPIPNVFKYLSAGIQNDTIVFWVMVNPNTLKTKRHFKAINTGVEFPDVVNTYIGTATSTTGIIWHLFEII